jgi:8-oxo-dGTP diphosphatase
MPVVKRKAVAYITHGDRLLAFSHPDFPEAGIQVPAGTIQPGERPEAAVMREAAEETGLAHLELVRALGIRMRDMSDFGRDEVHERHFFHLRCAGDPPATWRHHERQPSDESPGPIAFEFFWVYLPDELPELIADQGALLPELIELLARQR